MLKKDLAYYKSLQYKIIVEQEQADEETWYIAYTNELGKFACYGKGKTGADALASFEEEKNVFMGFLFENGKSIPEPEFTSC
jgi:predicted RNase H-like HicB family nuclease